jgi:hypothetical protein
MHLIAEGVSAPSPQTYRCGRCQVMFSESVRVPGRPDRAMDLNFKSLATMH